MIVAGKIFRSYKTCCKLQFIVTKLYFTISIIITLSSALWIVCAAGGASIICWLYITWSDRVIISKREPQEYVIFQKLKIKEIKFKKMYTDDISELDRVFRKMKLWQNTSSLKFSMQWESHTFTKISLLDLPCLECWWSCFWADIICCDIAVASFGDKGPKPKGWRLVTASIKACSLLPVFRACSSASWNFCCVSKQR